MKKVIVLLGLVIMLSMTGCEPAYKYYLKMTPTAEWEQVDYCSVSYSDLYATKGVETIKRMCNECICKKVDN